MRTALSIAATLLCAVAALADAPASRTVDATYVATITNIPSDAGKLTVWIPLPMSRAAQNVSDVAIDSPYTWHRATEGEFHDEYAWAEIPAPLTGEMTVRVHFRATRDAVAAERVANTIPTRREMNRALRADKMVTISPRIQKLADDITRGKTTTIDEAQAIYQYVVTTMTYDKTIPGWGRGDTERACDIKAGNCTDFHSLFISLARARSIPARFVIGFPLPQGDGTTKGYHCWAEFYVTGKGWIPVDASEASKSKDPAIRAFLFGNLPADRVEFTMGRDLELSPSTSEPVNFFIYPRVEANGKVVGTTTLSLEVRDFIQVIAQSPAVGALQK
jgi:transglutaminase-like putative cysteine protease